MQHTRAFAGEFSAREIVNGPRPGDMVARSSVLLEQVDVIATFGARLAASLPRSTH